jgi:Zn-dependent peptidase ImmA (M78 family)
MKKLNVLGQKVAVKIKPCLNPMNCGEYHFDTKDIYIDPSAENKFSIYVHEMVHAIFDRSGLNQTQTSHDVQEILCENIATVLTENFKVIVDAYNKLNKKKAISRS